MAQVCLLGEPGSDLRYELLSRETAREALSTYDLREPYANSLALDTVSIGAAVSLLNDLNWYLVRFARTALVQSDSVSETEWLSRDLAILIRDGHVDPDVTGGFLKVYGLEDGRPEDPTFVQRQGDWTPEREGYDDVLVVRVTEEEFE
ncbi:DUF5804 family protein [Halolamina rubra]|uniref:DUF5804 family protein n=1 Tax=Halolamina rubra TaxID=1380430 RepID=UPI00067990D7|nr:DUF5804 family protein [Halolamina rubra]